MMGERTQEIAAEANKTAYRDVRSDMSPHLKHASIRDRYDEHLEGIFEWAGRRSSMPTVLDLGAGGGAVTMPFVRLGAHVTAIDISATQLERLQERCAEHADRLDVVEGDCLAVLEALAASGRVFDVVVVNSFLHHIPDYLRLIEDCCAVLAPAGQFFSFQDPVKYASLTAPQRMFGKVAYASWRIFRGDVIAGTKRYLRRSRGVFLDDCAQDNAEYHVLRDGVDQDAIQELLSRNGFDVTIDQYFSTQSGAWQPLGAMLGVQNTFAVIARRDEEATAGYSVRASTIAG